jgi:outer membrane protein assembly factor BamB
MIRMVANFLFGVLLASSQAVADHRVLLTGNGTLAIVEPNGSVSWEMPFGSVHDLHVLPSGNILTVQDYRQVVEIDRTTKKVVWSYDASANNGNAGKRIEIHAIQPLENGNVMIAESGASRIIEINQDGKLLKSFSLKLDKPDPHRDTRLARKLSNGHYLAAHEGDGVIREYDGDGKMVWEYPVPLFDKPRADGHGPESFGNQAFSAIRLDNGNTLIGTGNGHSVLEVTPEKKIVWELHQKDLPGITLSWVTTLTILPKGNLVIGNCHAGPGQPVLIEIDRNTKKVVWKYDGYEKFGNDVTNSVLLDGASK